jgi:hypothetical protein
VAYRFDLVAQQVEETEQSRRGCSPARKVLGAEDVRAAALGLQAVATL